MSNLITIESKDKKTYFIVTFEETFIKLEYEIYGDGDGGFDMETIYTIRESEFGKIVARYGKSPSDSIRKIIELIGAEDRVLELKKDIQGGFFASEKFVWSS